MMLRGVAIDEVYKNELKGNLLRAIVSRIAWMEEVLGHSFNPASTGAKGDMQRLFYDDFKIPPIFNRKTKARTLDDDALEKVKVRQPLLIPLINAIEEYRSLCIFRKNYADARLDADLRMRCSFNITGAETYRLSSSKSIWGTGANLQTISAGSKD